jgi:hypothetical protein
MTTSSKAMPFMRSNEEREDAAIAQLIVNSLRTHSIKAVQAPLDHGFDENCCLDQNCNHDGMDYVSRVISRLVGAGVTTPGSKGAPTVLVHYHNGVVYFTLDPAASQEPAAAPVVTKPSEAPSVPDVRACMDAAAKRLADKKATTYTYSMEDHMKRRGKDAAAVVVAYLAEICKNEHNQTEVDHLLANGFPISCGLSGYPKKCIGNAAFMAALNAELAPTGWHAGFTSINQQLLLSPLEPETVSAQTEPEEDQVIKNGVSSLIMVCKIRSSEYVGAFMEIATSPDFVKLLNKTNVRERVNSSIAPFRWRVSHWRSTNVFLERVATDWEGNFCREFVHDLRMLREDVLLSNFSEKLGCGDVVVDVSKDLYRRLIDLEFRSLVNDKVLPYSGWRIDCLTTGARLVRIC